MPYLRAVFFFKLGLLRVLWFCGGAVGAAMELTEPQLHVKQLIQELV